MNKRSSRWHPGSKSSPNCSASPFVRAMSKKERGERDWNSERILFTDKRVSSLRTGIRRKLQDVLRDLAPLEKQGKIEGFVSNTENATQLGGLVESIRDSMMEYQVRPSNPSSQAASDISARLHCNKGYTIINKACATILTAKLVQSW